MGNGTNSMMLGIHTKTQGICQFGGLPWIWWMNSIIGSRDYYGRRDADSWGIMGRGVNNIQGNKLQGINQHDMRHWEPDYTQLNVGSRRTIITMIFNG